MLKIFSTPHGLVYELPEKGNSQHGHHRRAFEGAGGHGAIFASPASPDRGCPSPTANNQVITLNICANYGGRWGMIQATQAWQKAHPGQFLDALTEEALTSFLSAAGAPPVDLLIRTGGEFRVSNLLLWQAAYAELFFCDELWPDFTHEKNPTGLVMVCHTRPKVWVLCAPLMLLATINLKQP